MNQIPHDLKSLTSLRFFAAFWVFLFHLRSRLEYEANWFWDVVENGARGVDFFFILSGFVIFHVYEPQISAGRFSFRDYLIKRIARIYPLHLAMLVLFVLVALVGNNPIRGLLPSITLLHSWGITGGEVLNAPSWTLSAEIFAYILFGLLVFRSPPTWMLLAVFVVTAIGAHFCALYIGKEAFLHLAWDFGSVRIIPTFILGMLLRRLLPLISMQIGMLLGVLGLGLFLLRAGSQNVGYEILIPFSLLIVSGARLSDQKWLPTNSQILTYLGEISYSTYMIHIFAIAVWFDYMPKFGIAPLPWPILCIAVIFGSSLSYHLIEVPARRFINNRFTSSRKQTA